MKKIILSLLLVCASELFALQIGDSIEGITLEDQFEKVHTIPNDTKLIFFTASRDESGIIKDYLAEQKADFLASQKAVYIADLSGMPSVITSLFALPKMRKYKFSMLLLDEKHEKQFVSTDDKITVYEVENAKVKSVKNISTKEEFIGLFSGK